MIEQLFPGGGGTDEKAAVSSNDTTPGYLNGKLVAGAGVSLTENNNGGNETLTIASTVVDTNDAAKVSSNDTTAGFLNGKLVAGSGIALTENNNGGNETLGISVANIDASAITTGTVATARLGSGTANSTTYLAGDQTYKAAVTSVNGSTGAVTVAAGDTTYTVTTADAENTTTNTTVASFTIPANTWVDGQTVELRVVTHASQSSGGSVNWTGRIGGTGITERSTAATAVGNSAFQWRNVTTFRFFREGNTVTFTVLNPQSLTGTYNDAARWPFDNNGAMTGPINWLDYDSSVDFTTNITIDYKMQWGTANAATYVRVVNARAVKYNGGNV